MSAYYEQPLRKLLGSLSQTIGWLSEKGTVEVNTVPAEHLEAIKQLEKIGIVHKRNNKIYELQKVRLKKLMDNMGMDSLPPPQPAPVAVPPVLPVAMSIQPTPVGVETPPVVTGQPVVAAVEKSAVMVGGQSAVTSVEKSPVVASAVVEPGGIN